MLTRSGLIRISQLETTPPPIRKDVSPLSFPAKTRKSSHTALSHSPKEHLPLSFSAKTRKSSHTVRSHSPKEESPGWMPPKTRKKQSPSRKAPLRNTPRTTRSSKSPSRKSSTNFPARKSPSRSSKENTKNASQSPARRPLIKLNPQVVLNKIEAVPSVRTRQMPYLIEDISSIVTQSEMSIEDKVNGVDPDNGLKNRKAEELVVALRRSSTLHDANDNIPESPSSYSRSASISGNRSIDTIRDGDNSDEVLQREHSRSLTRTLITPVKESINDIMFRKWEFGGRLGSITLMLLIPLAVFGILISCAKPHTSLLDLTIYKNISSWYSTQAAIAIIGQFILQAIFPLIPIFGTNTSRMDGTRKEYCFNAHFASIFTMIVVFTLYFFKVFDCDAILKEYVQLALISYFYAIVLSIMLYTKSLKMDNSVLNPYISTRYKLYDFFVGREIHPYIKKLDIKLFISRTSNITSLILAVLIFKHGIHIENVDICNLSLDNYGDILGKVQLKPTLLVYSTMQTIYILSFIMREYKITTTLFWQYEGMGYLQIVSSALYPFFFTTISKFVADADLSLPTNILIVASVLYVMGLLIMLISNNVKFQFRKNPISSRAAFMWTLQGNKLLTSNLWGILRHPNYAGDMLVHIALALPGLWTGQYMAAAPAILTILALAYRARRDHCRCLNRYEAAWQRYCKQVPSVILPKLL